MQRRGNRPAHAKLHARTGFHCRQIQQKPSPERPPGRLLRLSFKKQTRVQLYLPIADIPVNVFLILAMGAAVGFVSGMFGIGGGFLMTPLLIFVGIAPAVAVASVASHIAASSFSGALSYWRRRAIDPLLAAVLLTGGTMGTALGVWTFTLLRSLGQLDLMIATVLRDPADHRRRADVLGRPARAAAGPARRRGHRCAARAAMAGSTACR